MAANEAVADTVLGVLDFDDPPPFQPMLRCPELEECMDQNPAFAIRTWVSMRTMLSPMSAIGFDPLYKLYAADFRHYEIKYPRLDMAQFMKLVNESVGGIDFLDEEGVLIIKGLRWTTSKDLDRMTQDLFRTTYRASRAVPLPKELRTSQCIPTYFESPRNDQLEPDQYNVDKIDGDGKYQAWLKDSLVIAPQSTVDVGELWLAFKAKWAEPDETDPTMGPTNINIKQLLRLVAECFSHVQFEKKVICGIGGLRWKVLDESYTRSVSVHNMHEGFPKWIKEEAHKLLYLSKKRRAKAFLFMLFEKTPGTTVSLRSMWKFYCIAFARSSDTHELLHIRKFLEVLCKTFKGLQIADVSDKHRVVLDLSIRDQSIPAEEYIALKRYYDFKRREGIQPSAAKNRFNEKLMESPMLALPPRRRSFEYLSWKPHDEMRIFDGSAAPGPLIQRLRRRAHNPPLPLGDEEPGFPGLSMKLVQKTLKRNVEAWKLAEAKLFDGDPAGQPVRDSE